MNPRPAKGMKDELLFLPLGGAGEIGMNLNLYGWGGKWLMVDLGVTFADEGQPGVDLIIPDPEFIVERRQDLLGLVLTHAHEDHIGAVPSLWPWLRCPVWATPFTAAVLRRKLDEAGLADEVPVNIVPLGGRFQIGAFDLELLSLTHSIPEPNALIIRTPAGTVLHTGDWKLDPDPVIGPGYDEAALRRLGDEGVLAMVCDSTNALVPGTSGSEGDLEASLTEIVAGREGRVGIACFSSNLARLETVARVARATGRQMALVGRSLWRMNDAARETGYLADVPAFLSGAEAMQLPRERVLFACTGSQGEPRAALARMVSRGHPDMELDEGDTIVFSSRVIPGNDVAIHRLQNDLVRLGVHVVTSQDHFVHVSGHPARDELTSMYQWVRPRTAVPVHGELRHLRAHAELATECQVAETVVIENGAMLRLGPGPATVVDHHRTGRLAVEGDIFLDLNGATLRQRRRIMYNGAVTASVLVDGDGLPVEPPRVTLGGVADDGEGSFADELSRAAEDAIEGLSRKRRADDDAVAEAARLAIRRTVNARFRKRPVTDVHVYRIDGGRKRK